MKTNRDILVCARKSAQSITSSTASKRLYSMDPKVFFGLVVVGSMGIIFYVHYQREQEKKFMRRNIMKELEEMRSRGQQG